MQQTFLTTGFLWCGVLIKPIVNDLSESPHCMVHMVTAPTAYYPSLSDLKLFTSARLAGLKDFFENRYVDKIGESPSPSGHVIKSSGGHEVIVNEKGMIEHHNIGGIGVVFLSGSYNHGQKG